MHTSMPIIAGRWIREYGEAMLHRVAHHFLYPRQIKQIAGVHMANEASRVRGHQRTARHRLADHIVGMVKANPSVTVPNSRQMINPTHTIGQAELVTPASSMGYHYIVNDRITDRHKYLRG